MITKQEYEQGIKDITKMLESGEIVLEEFIRYHEVLDLEFYGSADAPAEEIENIFNLRKVWNPAK